MTKNWQLNSQIPFLCSVQSCKFNSNFRWTQIHTNLSTSDLICFAITGLFQFISRIALSYFTTYLFAYKWLYNEAIKQILWSVQIANQVYSKWGQKIWELALQFLQYSLVANKYKFQAKSLNNTYDFSLIEQHSLPQTTATGCSSSCLSTVCQCWLK